MTVAGPAGPEDVRSPLEKFGNSQAIGSVETLVTFFAASRANARPEQLEGTASRGPSRPADGDRLSAVLDYERARQALRAAARQLANCLLPLPLWVYRDPAFRAPQAGSSCLPPDPFLRPSPARRTRRCGDSRRLLRDGPAAAD